MTVHDWERCPLCCAEDDDRSESGLFAIAAMIAVSVVFLLACWLIGSNAGLWGQ